MGILHLGGRKEVKITGYGSRTFSIKCTSHETIHQSMKVGCSFPFYANRIAAIVGCPLPVQETLEESHSSSKSRVEASKSHVSLECGPNVTKL
eukprot:scaffold626_cov337-Pavlova_lutheri.AAC.63